MDGSLIIMRGSLFIDLDGTVLHTDTEQSLPYAVEKINEAYDNGFLIVLTTFRGLNWNKESRFSKNRTEQLLEKINLKYHHIIWDSPSPRIIINDDIATAYRHPTNESWKNLKIMD